MSDSAVKMSLDDWKEKAKLIQENFCMLLGDRTWDEFSYPSEKEHLFKKIAIALNDSYSELKNDFDLPAEKIELINTFIEKFHNYSIYKDKICIGIIFVSVFSEDAIITWVPVFRVLQRVEENQMIKEDVQNNVFIDHIGRVYKDYSSYLCENTWERSWLCLPEYGYYYYIFSECENFNPINVSERKLDECYDSYGKEIIHKNRILFHDQTCRGTVTKIIDTYANYFNIGSSIGMLGGLLLTFFPPTAPIGATAVAYSGLSGTPGAIYSVGRNLEKILNRYIHDQSISFADSEARQCWLITGTFAASMGALSSAQILTRMAKNGVAVTTATRGICTGMTVTATALSGISTVNSFYELYTKEEVTTLEIIQFSASLFFFAHTLVSFKTAETMIKEAQQAEIAAMKSNISQENHRKFDNLLENAKKSAGKKAAVGEENIIHGQAQFIRKLKRIDDPNEYFQSIRITKKGNYCINNKLSINPKSYLTLTDNEERILLNSTKDLQDKKITVNDFNNKVKPLVNKHRMGVVGSETNHAKSKTVVNNKATGTASSNVNDFNQGKAINKKRSSNVNVKQSEESLVNVNNSSLNNEMFKDIINSFFIDFMHEIKEVEINLIQHIASFIQKLLKDEIQRRIEENSNPQRPDSMQVEQFYASQVSNERKFKNLCESACKLVTTCRDYNIEIPVRCLEFILENIEGKIFNVMWSKNEPLVTCHFLSEPSNQISFDFHIGNKHFVTNIFRNGTSINKPVMHPLPDRFVKLTTFNEDKFLKCYESLSDLATSCSEINTILPQECFDFIMKHSKGIIYDIKWFNDNNCVICTFLTEQSVKMTIEFILGDTFFLSKVHKNGILCEDLKINHLQLNDD